MTIQTRRVIALCALLASSVLATGCLWWGHEWREERRERHDRSERHDDHQEKHDNHEEKHEKHH